MNICEPNGWTENNRPSCAWCMNQIGVRGDTPGNAVLGGEVLLTVVDGKVTRISHFDCERHIWRMATKAGTWYERFLGGAKLMLVSSRMEWAERQPWIVSA
jgi:hypothetical protein